MGFDKSFDEVDGHTGVDRVQGVVCVLGIEVDHGVTLIGEAQLNMGPWSFVRAGSAVVPCAGLDGDGEAVFAGDSATDGD